MTRRAPFPHPIRLASAILAAASLICLAVVPVSPAAGLVPGRAPRAVPRPLGTFSIGTGAVTDCPAGFTCEPFTVAGCPDPAGGTFGQAGELATLEAPGATGMTLFFSGSRGDRWWGAGGADARFFSSLAASGVTSVQVRWDTGWLVSPPGHRSGPAAMACIPATVIRWLHDHRYVPTEPPPGPGACGFCLSGNSSGASAVAYAASVYGEDAIVAGLFPTSGPAHASIQKGCGPNGAASYRFPDQPPPHDEWTRELMDDSYGFDGSDAHSPCVAQNAAMDQVWARDSVDWRGNDFSFPGTRVEFVLGGADDTHVPPHAHDYCARLAAAGTPVRTVVIPTMPHLVDASAAGLQQLFLAITDQAPPPSGAPCPFVPPPPSRSPSSRTPSSRPARQLGVLQIGSGIVSRCVARFRCRPFEVSRCPDGRGGTFGATGAMATYATPSPSGLAVFFSGSRGDTWWDGEVGNDAFFAPLAAHHIEAVQIRWDVGWLVAPRFAQLGPSVLACLPATVIRWVHDHRFVPMHAPVRPGRCGFCLTGNSAGASAVSYALSVYGLDPIVNGLFPTSGPPHAAIQKGCLLDGSPAYRFPLQPGPHDEGARQLIDDSYGFKNTNGHAPCANGNPSYVGTWARDSVDRAGNDFAFPTTRVVIIVGGRDDEHVPAHAHDYCEQLAGHGTHVVTLEVRSMPHLITQSTTGMRTLLLALTGTSPPRQRDPCPTPAIPPQGATGRG